MINSTETKNNVGISDVYVNTQINENRIEYEYQIPYKERFGKVGDNYVNLLRKYGISTNEYFEREKQRLKYLEQLSREEKEKKKKIN